MDATIFIPKNSTQPKPPLSRRTKPKATVRLNAASAANRPDLCRCCSQVRPALLPQAGFCLPKMMNSAFVRLIVIVVVEGTGAGEKDVSRRRRIDDSLLFVPFYALIVCALFLFLFSLPFGVRILVLCDVTLL